MGNSSDSSELEFKETKRGAGKTRDTIPDDRLDDEIQDSAATALLNGGRTWTRRERMKPTLDR